MSGNTNFSRKGMAVVFVVDDDPSIRAAIQDLLESISLDVRVFESLTEFLNYNYPDVPACLVLDIRMPGMSGLEFQRKLEEFDIEIPIIFITAHGDIPMSVQAMKAGAVDFLPKPFRDQDLIDAINAGIEIDRKRRQERSALQDLQYCYEKLTAGEKKVMQLMINGLLNKQIAAELGVSEITVKVRRSQIRRKMRAGSVAELVRMAEKLCIYTSA